MIECEVLYDVPASEVSQVCTLAEVKAGRPEVELMEDIGGSRSIAGA